MFSRRHIQRELFLYFRSLLLFRLGKSLLLTTYMYTLSHTHICI